MEVLGVEIKVECVPHLDHRTGPEWCVGRTLQIWAGMTDDQEF